MAEARDVTGDGIDDLVLSAYYSGRRIAASDAAAAAGVGQVNIIPGTVEA